MVSANVNNLLRQAQDLTLAEREEFLELLKRHTGVVQPPDAEAMVDALARKGIKLTIPLQRTSEELARFRAWRPIEMPGGSLSDELIRERR